MLLRPAVMLRTTVKYQRPSTKGACCWFRLLRRAPTFQMPGAPFGAISTSWDTANAWSSAISTPMACLPACLPSLILTCRFYTYSSAIQCGFGALALVIGQEPLLIAEGCQPRVSPVAFARDHQA